MRHPNAEVMAEVFPTVPIKDGLEPHETLLSITKAQRVRGYQSQWSWRDENTKA